MSRHSNVGMLRAFDACFEHEDCAALVRVFLAPSVVWHVAGNNPLAGEFRGPDAVTDQMLRYAERSRRSLRLDTSIMGTDSHAVAVHRATASRPGFGYRAHEIDVFRVAGDRSTDFWSFSED